MIMLYLKRFFWILIFYVLAVNLQRVLAITKSLDNRRVCYLTTTRELTTTIKELFTSTIMLDKTSLFIDSVTTLLVFISLTFLTSLALPFASLSTSLGYMFNS